MRNFFVLFLIFMFNYVFADVQNISLLDIQYHFTALDNSKLKNYIEDRYYNEILTHIEIQTILNSIEHASEETRELAIELFAAHGLANEVALLLTRKANESFLGPNIASELTRKYVFSGNNQVIIEDNAEFVTDILLSWRYPDNLNDIAAGRGVPDKFSKNESLIYQINNKIWGRIDSNTDIVKRSNEVKVSQEYDCKAELTKHNTVQHSSSALEIDSEDILCKIYKANITMETWGRSIVILDSKIDHQVNKITIWSKSSVTMLGGRSLTKEDFTSKVTLNHNVKINIPKCNNIFECFPIVKVLDKSTSSYNYSASVLKDGLKSREYTVIRSKDKEIQYGMNFKDTHTGASTGRLTAQNLNLEIFTNFPNEILKEKTTSEIFDHFQFLVELSVKNKNTDDLISLGQLASEIAKRCKVNLMDKNSEMVCFNGLYNILSSTSHYEAKLKEVDSDLLYFVGLVRGSAQELFKGLFYKKLKNESIVSFNNYLSIFEQIKNDSKLFQEILLADLVTPNDNNQIINILKRYNTLEGTTNLIINDLSYFLNLNINERRNLLGALIRYLESHEYYFRNDFYKKVKLLAVIEKEDDILNFEEYLNSTELVQRGLQ
jgi:hypothetical protein